MSIKRLSGCQLSEGVSGQGLAERTGRPAPEGPPAPSNAAAARPATVAGGGGGNMFGLLSTSVPAGTTILPLVYEDSRSLELLRLTPSIIP